MILFNRFHLSCMQHCAAGADPVVQSTMQVLLTYAKYRAWNTQVKQARTNRLLKELS